MPDVDVPLHFTIKVASRCNLNCSYCYVYNKADHSWRDRPAIMSDDIYTATLQRIRRHCLRSKQTSVRIVFHGGEPLAAGIHHFRDWLALATDGLSDIVNLELNVQTNATLITEEWANLFRHYRVSVGISLDGPRAINDLFRVYQNGRSSYDEVIRGVRFVRQAGISVGLLSVVQPGADSVELHRHLVELGPRTIDYILPDYTHDTIASVHLQHGPHPCADFLIPIFDDWWYNGTLDVRISPFEPMAKAILGGESAVDFIGNPPLRYLFVETDGSIEGLDVLRVCRQGIAATGLNVLTHDFTDVACADQFHGTVVFDGIALPSACRGCIEQDSCAGGYLPHRYRAASGFDNPSVWCRDLLRLFGHIRNRLNVDPAETMQRRQRYEEQLQIAH